MILRRLVLILTVTATMSVALARCSMVQPEHHETYRWLLATLCAAPPNIMAQVLTTPDLQRAWGYICGHQTEVPDTPVP
jgi:hypothetical protein